MFLTRSPTGTSTSSATAWAVDELVVGVGENPEKGSLLRAPERLEIVRQAVAGIPNVRVEPFSGLTVDFARKLKAAAILRGLRNTADLHFEFQLALTNRVVAGVETVFIMTSPELAFTSSSLIKQIARMGGDVQPSSRRRRRRKSRPSSSKGKKVYQSPMRACPA